MEATRRAPLLRLAFATLTCLAAGLVTCLAAGLACAEDLAPTLQDLQTQVASGATPRQRSDAAEDIAERFFDPETLVPWLEVRLEVERNFHVRLALAYAFAAQGEKEGLRILIDALERRGHLGYVYLEGVSERSFGGPGKGWNRPAWVTWLAELDETGWRELQRKRHLRREPVDADLAGLERAITWWNGLGFPDVGTLPLVRVHTGWIKAGDETSQVYEYAFLLEDDKEGLRVFNTDLATVGLVLENEDGTHRTRFEKADLVADVTRDLEINDRDRRSARSYADTKRDPFGVDFYWMPHRFRGFVLATALYARGERDLALRVWRHISGNSLDGPRHGMWSVVELLRGEVYAQTLEVWRASILKEAQSWRESLDAYRAWRARFPAGENDAWEDETERILARMATEESGYEAAARGEAKTVAERARLLVLALPTVRMRGPRRLGQAGPGDPGQADALSRLIDLGMDAVPALIAALEDRRFTKSAAWQFGSKGYIRPTFTIDRVQELALDALETIAQRSFRSPGGDWATAREAAEAWRVDTLTRGECTVLVAGVKAADDASPLQATRLIERYPDVALAAIREALEIAEGRVALRLLHALAKLHAPDVVAYLETRAREGRVAERMAAAWALGAHGSSAGVEALLADWPGIAQTPIEGPPGIPVLGHEPVPGLVALLYALSPLEALARMRQELDVTPAPVKFELIREIHEALGHAWSYEPDQPADRPQPPEVHQAAEALLVEMVLDTAEREGTVYASTSNGPMERQPNGVGEYAAARLVRIWPDRHAFDPKATFRVRLAQRYAILNAWRAAHDLDPLRMPEPPHIERVPAPTLRPLLDAWRASAEGDEYARAETAIVALGLGTIPLLEEEHAGATDPDAKTRLETLLRHVAAIVREVHWTGKGPEPDPAWRARIAALEGKTIRGRVLTELFRQCAVGLPKGATGIDLRLDRAGDDTGYVLRIGLTSHTIPWRGGSDGGFILGGDGQELVDTFLGDPDSWWHRSRGAQLDEELLAAPDEEVHLHRSFVRAVEP